jgi:hypothetical protein
MKSKKCRTFTSKFHAGQVVSHNVRVETGEVLHCNGFKTKVRYFDGTIGMPFSNHLRLKNAN